MSAVYGRTRTQTDNKATNTKGLYYTENGVTHETASTALRRKVISAWMFSLSPGSAINECYLFSGT